MCDVNGQFKLCTCSEKIDKKKPYWVLKSNREEGEEVGVVMLLVVWAILLGGDNCLLVICGALLFGRVLYDLVAACFAGLFP